jgi:hypothetical protein
MSGRLVDDGTRLIWATRGRTWGFRFVRRGGFDEPLAVYERAFSGIGDQAEEWGRVADNVALRFPDPEGRSDASGRVIPHDFVLVGGWSAEVDSLDDGRRRVWPLVAAEFESIWDNPTPPV